MAKGNLTLERICTIEQKRRWIYGKIAVDRAYAKINLGLKVIGKREDGYHDLDMINAELALYDEIICYDSKMPSTVISNVEICDPCDNLAYKVIVLIKEKYNIEKNVKVEIIKKIPLGAGLGGGSADAAATIRALNELWNLRMTKEAMLEIALKIGSDVPYLIDGGFARVGGVGEVIHKIDSNISFYVVLVMPNYACSTKNIFTRYKDNNAINRIDKIQEALLDNDFKKLSENLFNNLQTAAEDYAAETGKIIPSTIVNVLTDNGCSAAVMTGSGSAVYGIAQDIFAAKVAHDKIKNFDKDLLVFFTKIIKEKPSKEDIIEEFYGNKQ